MTPSSNRWTFGDRLIVRSFRTTLLLKTTLLWYIHTVGDPWIATAKEVTHG
jgi:hypothetical protein